MVGRRLHEQELQARTLQLKLRYSDFTTDTRARTIETNVDGEIFSIIRALFRANWKRPAAVRLLGVHASTSSDCGAEQQQLGLAQASRHDRWSRAVGCRG